jgi:CheY-like chemotaxis protein
MDSAVLKTLFTPFTQADASTTRRYGGTGLGLAISKQLIELMQGRIDVNSAPGEGSTFRVTIPVEQATSLTEIDDPAAEASPAVVRGAHILVAEDNLLNQKVVTHMLTRLGHSVQIVSDGRQAVDAARRGRYDVILMDCQMPEMSGYDAARVIRRHGGSAAWLPIIALTANAMSTDRQRCIDAGMDDYITKPVNIATLAKVLDKWLLRSREAGAGPVCGRTPNTGAGGG